MAKPTFAKMGLKAKNDTKIIMIGEQEIEVKQYLPVQKRLELISNVANYSADANNFANPVKVEVMFDLEVVFAYTNITFTEKQKADLVKLYDLLKENGIFDLIIDAIPEGEYDSLWADTWSCISEIYRYQNSILGLLDIIKTDYNDTGLNIEELWSKLADRENVEFLQDVMTKLG